MVTRRWNGPGGGRRRTSGKRASQPQYDALTLGLIRPSVIAVPARTVPTLHASRSGLRTGTIGAASGSLDPVPPPADPESLGLSVARLGSRVPGGRQAAMER